MRLKIVLSILIMAVTLFGNNAFAHKVNLFCQVEGEVLVGEGYYSGGRPAQNAPIEVYSMPHNELIGETQTDDGGKFTFQPVSGISIKVIMRSGQGHKAEFLIDTSSKERKGVDPFSVLVGVGLIAVIFGAICLIKKRQNAF
jgi:nickel transport protein